MNNKYNRTLKEGVKTWYSCMQMRVKLSRGVNVDDIISNYWMKQDMKNSADQGGRYRPRWITTSETCRILYILRKPNSIIALSFVQNISAVLEGVSQFRSLFRSPKITQPRPQVFDDLQRAAHLTSFWRHRLKISNGLHFWRHLFNKTTLCPKLVSNSWLWWIVRVV